MNDKKTNYETPDMRVFEMHIEGVMCESPYGEVGDPGANGIFYNLEEEGDY